MRSTMATIFGATLVLAACGDSGGGAGPAGVGAGNDNGPAASSTADIVPCDLLTDAELTLVLGEAPPAEESEPAGPFTGCSWGTGDVLVSVAPSDSVILAPGEEDCPSAGLGDDSYLCEGRVKYVTRGIHVTVSTINPFVTDDQLLSLATTLLPKLQD